MLRFLSKKTPLKITENNLKDNNILFLPINTSNFISYCLACSKPIKDKSLVGLITRENFFSLVLNKLDDFKFKDEFFKQMNTYTLSNALFNVEKEVYPSYEKAQESQEIQNRKQRDYVREGEKDLNFIQACNGVIEVVLPKAVIEMIDDKIYFKKDKLREFQKDPRKFYPYIEKIYLNAFEKVESPHLNQDNLGRKFLVRSEKINNSVEMQKSYLQELSRLSFAQRLPPEVLVLIFKEHEKLMYQQIDWGFYNTVIGETSNNFFLRVEERANEQFNDEPQSSSFRELREEEKKLGFKK